MMNNSEIDQNDSTSVELRKSRDQSKLIDKIFHKGNDKRRQNY